MHLLPLAILIVLAVRYVPQFSIDLWRMREHKPVEHKTWARSVYVFALYGIIIAAFLYDLFTARPPNAIASWLALGLVAMGVVLGLLSILRLGEAYCYEISISENFELKTTGVYSLVRHPFRLSVMLETLGVSLFFGRFILLGLWLMIIVILIIRTRQEEAFLIKHAGHAYQEYAQKVPGFNILAGLFRRIRTSETDNSSVVKGGESPDDL